MLLLTAERYGDTTDCLKTVETKALSSVDIVKHALINNDGYHMEDHINLKLDISLIDFFNLSHHNVLYIDGSGMGSDGPSFA